MINLVTILATDTDNYSSTTKLLQVFIAAHILTLNLHVLTVLPTLFTLEVSNTQNFHFDMILITKQ